MLKLKMCIKQMNGNAPIKAEVGGLFFVFVYCNSGEKREHQTSTPLLKTRIVTGTFWPITGSFMLLLHTKTDLYVVIDITITALVLQCVPYVGMDVMQYIQ